MSHQRWNMPESEMVGLTPAKARELIEECFYQAQCETFARAKEKLGSSDTSPDSIRKAVTGAVRTAFREVGGDYEEPDVLTLRRVVEVLARKADSWGTPTDIVQHHGGQIMRMLDRL